MRKGTARAAAILGVIFSGVSGLFLFATAMVMQWNQPRLHSDKDWGAIFGIGFGVLFVCCALAAILSFLVAAFRLITTRLLGSQQPLGTELPTVSEQQQKREIPYSGIIGLVGLAVCIASVHFGPVAFILIGIPVLLVTCGVAGGARSPRRVPLRDGILYVGISVVLVVAIAIYALYHH